VLELGDDRRRERAAAGDFVEVLGISPRTLGVPWARRRTAVELWSGWFMLVC